MKKEVDFLILKPVDFDYTLLASCLVGYPKLLEMSFQQEGIIKEGSVKEGDKAEKEFKRAQARFNQLKTEMENLEKRRLLASLPISLFAT